MAKSAPLTRASVPVTGAKPRDWTSKRTGGLAKERDHLMSEVAVLRAQAKAPPRTIGNAVALLTRHWAHASWQEREELLRAARFVLRTPWPSLSS